MVDLRAQLLDVGIERAMATGPHAAIGARPDGLASAVGADEADTWALDLVRRAGSRHPERDLGIMANHVTGLVFHELALPTPDLDAAGRARTLIDAFGWTPG